VDEAGDAHGSTGYRRRRRVPPSAIIVVVGSSLSGIAVEKRKQLAATLGLFAMLFVAVGAVAGTGAHTAVVKAFIVIALVVAVVLALLAWGVLRSVRDDLAEQRLDAVIEQTVRAHGRSLCDCGHEHDPDELHVVDGEARHVTGSRCASDGAGVDCAHSCDACVLGSLRLEPAAAFARPDASALRDARRTTRSTSSAPRRPRPGPGTHRDGGVPNRP
jgi:hypothetical protein